MQDNTKNWDMWCLWLISLGYDVALIVKKREKPETEGSAGSHKRKVLLTPKIMNHSP